MYSRKSTANGIPYSVANGIELLPQFQNNNRFRFSCHKFSLICKKYEQYLYLQIIFKKLDLNIFPMILMVYYKY